MKPEDQAQELELAMWESTQRAAIRPPAPMGPAECDECGSPMPQVRREHGFRLCVVCATEQERMARFVWGGR